MLFPVVMRRRGVWRWFASTGGMRCDLTLEPLDCADPEADFPCHLADADPLRELAPRQINLVGLGTGAAKPPAARCRPC
jgi:hypothetical protein